MPSSEYICQNWPTMPRAASSSGMPRILVQNLYRSPGRQSGFGSSRTVPPSVSPRGASGSLGMTTLFAFEPQISTRPISGLSQWTPSADSA